MVKLEAGKYYKTRDGRKVGPMRDEGRSVKHPFICEIAPTPECSIHTAIWECDGKNYELRNLDIVSEWVDYSSCRAVQVDVQREEYGPIRTRREIVPGPCGKFDIREVWRSPAEVSLSIFRGHDKFTAEELREAAHLFNHLAEVLDERT